MKHPSAALAAKLSAMGRHGDSTLVHMGENEVRGLASLGKLTVNPKTGLLEAFSIGDVLPIAAAAASEYFFPGNPWAAAAFAGGTSALQGGNTQQILSNAALAGGGSSLLGSLAGPATTGAASGEEAAQLASAGGNAGIQGAGIDAATAALGGAGVAPAVPDTFMNKLSRAGTTLSNMTGSDAAKFYANNKMGLGLTAGGAMGLAGLAASQQQAALMDQRVKQQQADQQARLAGVTPAGPPPPWETQGGQSLYDTYAARFAPKPYGFAGGGSVQRPVTSADLAIEAAKTALPAPVRAQQQPPQSVVNSLRSLLSGREMIGPNRVGATNQNFNAMFPKVGPTYAGGGIVSLQGGGLAPLPGMAQEIARRRSATSFIRSTYPDIIHARADLRNPDSPLLKLGIRSPTDPLLTAAFGGGGTEVQGPGDGQSDSVPAVIDGTQAAALSSGEFITPAHTVAALGNGSTKAGASRLHAMVDRINRTAGVPKKPGNVTEDVLPA